MLRPIEEVPGYVDILYNLLAERTPEQSISHREMPTKEQHTVFVDGEPYFCWYMIIIASQPVGSVYLTDQREIGIAIFKKHRGQGYAKQAVKDIIALHPGDFLANINPDNFASRMFFTENFRTERIQETYRCSL